MAFPRAFFFGLGIYLSLGLAACSSEPKKRTPGEPTEVHLDRLLGKKVALVEIEGESTGRKVVEVALVNQLLREGTFILVPKKDLDLIRQTPESETAQAQDLARRAGADFALKVRLLEFEANETQGFNEEEIEDSQLKAERGGSGITRRLNRVRSLQGQVRAQLEFIDVNTSEVQIGIAQHTDQVTVEQKTSAAHLPPRLRFLEAMTQKAFEHFFSESGK